MSGERNTRTDLYEVKRKYRGQDMARYVQMPKEPTTADSLLVRNEEDNSYTLPLGSAKYLGEVINSLPTNSMFNKVTTGCGGTTIALESDEPYVICVPFVSLIQNKVKNYPNVQPVYGGITREELDDYKGSKWMVTYDSLWKVIERIDPSQYRLLIDESHKLIDSGSFRGKAIRRVKSDYDKFKSYTFMSATPVKRKYLPPWLANLKTVNADWDKDRLEEVNIEDIAIDNGQSIENYVASRIIDILDGEKEVNPYVFMNSVTGICKIVAKLKNSGYGCEAFSIVCANRARNDEMIQRMLGREYGDCVNRGLIGQTVDDKVQVVSQSRVTFITSTMFEGCDIHDEDGVTYIVADGTKEHTRYDIGTTIPQIIGRIRNSKYKADTTLIYKPSPMYTYTKEEEFEEVVKEKMEEAKSILATYDNASPTLKEIIEDGSRTNPYFTTNENKELIADEEAWYNQMHQWEALHKTYYVNRDWETGEMIRESGTITINSIDYNYNSADAEETLSSKLSMMKVTGRTNFKALMKEYIRLAKESFTNSDKMGRILMIDDEVEKIYDQLGTAKIRALRYSKAKLMAELNRQSNGSDDDKIFTALQSDDWNRKYHIGAMLTVTEIKKDLQTIMNGLDIQGTAKGSRISQYFETRATKKKVDDKRREAYKLVSMKYRIPRK